MDVSKILAELKSERQQIDEAILRLERLERGGAPRRGRPPAWLAEAASRRRGRPPGSMNTVPAQPDAARYGIEPWPPQGLDREFELLQVEHRLRDDLHTADVPENLVGLHHNFRGDPSAHARPRRSG